MKIVKRWEKRWTNYDVVETDDGLYAWVHEGSTKGTDSPINDGPKRLENFLASNSIHEIIKTKPDVFYIDDLVDATSTSEIEIKIEESIDEPIDISSWARLSDGSCYFCGHDKMCRHQVSF